MKTSQTIPLGDTPVFMDEEVTDLVRVTDGEKLILVGLRGWEVINGLNKSEYRVFLEDEPEKLDDDEKGTYLVKVRRENIYTGYTEWYHVWFYFDLTVGEIELIKYK